MPRYNHHLCSDSVGWKSYREIVTQSSFDGAEHVTKRFPRMTTMNTSMQMVGQIDWKETDTSQIITESSYDGADYE